MIEIIPYITLIFLIIVLELVQISFTNSKSRKWILPVLSFLLSVCIMIYLITFELANQTGTDRIRITEVHLGTWLMFPVLNIPTIIFIATIIIFNTLNNRNAKD